jgi:hypothetical protein
LRTMCRSARGVLFVRRSDQRTRALAGPAPPRPRAPPLATPLSPGRCLCRRAARAAAHFPRVSTRRPPPLPPPRTNWTRRVPHPVLIGHAATRRCGRRGSPGAPRSARACSSADRSLSAARRARSHVRERGEQSPRGLVRALERARLRCIHEAGPRGARLLVRMEVGVRRARLCPDARPPLPPLVLTGHAASLTPH